MPIRHLSAPCPYSGRRARVPSVFRGAVLACLLLAAVELGACGYQPEHARLPQNANSITIGRIRNQSAVGEVDVLARSAIRTRLQNVAGVRVVEFNRADLILNVDINTVRISRTRATEFNSLLGITYFLRAQLKVMERVTSASVLDTIVTARAYSSIGTSTTENPGIREQLLRDLADNLAENIVTLLLEQ